MAQNKDLGTASQTLPTNKRDSIHPSLVHITDLRFNQSINKTLIIEGNYLIVCQLIIFVALVISNIRITRQKKYIID